MSVPNTQSMPPDKLRDHVFQTYNSLRVGMGTIAILFPIVMVVAGCLVEVGWLTSLSAYYFGLSPVDLKARMFPGIFPTRILFSGTLAAVGTFLFLYKGFSRLENRLLNAAGIFACGVALCPMWFESYDPKFPYEHTFRYLSYAHGTFAVLLFLCMACVVWFCTNDTLKFLPEDRAKPFRAIYTLIAILMAAFPILALLITTLAAQPTHFILAAEALGVFTFGAYWLVKSWELRSSEAEKRALNSIPATVSQQEVALGKKV